MMAISLSELDSILESARPETTLFLTGAGVSLASPSCLPDGEALTRRAVAWAFVDDPLTALVGEASDRHEAGAGLYSQLGIVRSLPRLEVVLGVASNDDAHGTRALEVLLGDMRRALPNPMHRFFAEHLGLGGGHITANFDTCIERAMSDPGAASAVLHFHRSVDTGLEQLGATFRVIERGFDDAMKLMLIDALRGHDLLVVVGYGGHDVFDVVPFLAELASRADCPLSHLTVIWLQHSSTPLCPTSDEPRSPLDSFEALPPAQREWLAEEAIDWPWQQRQYLEAAGACVVYCVGDSQRLLQQLADGWGLRVGWDEYGECAEQGDSSATDLIGKIRATALLWHTFGDYRRLATLISHHRGVLSRVWADEAEADLAWHEGRYRDAGRIWSRCRPRATPAERARWDERQIACRWVAGRYVTALVRSRRAWRRATRAGVVEPELAEVWARTVDHASRSPELRVLARIAGRSALAALDAVVERGGLGEHLQIRIASARNAIAEGRQRATGERNATARARFIETESLAAVVNYRQGRLRFAAEARTLDPDRYRDQLHWCEVLGLLGDANRVPFLPGAESAFDLQETFHAIRANQFGTVQRARLGVRAVALRARRRTRRRTTG